MAEGPGFAPAKVNLSLHVTGRRADGMHLLDSLVAFAGTGDRLSAAPADVSSLDLRGPMAAGVPADGRNLVLRAAHFFGATARFTLEKNLPAAAGIGGGSSDAAAALRLLAQLTGRPIPAGTQGLGADVPVCLTPRAQRMGGVGERLAPVDLPPLPALLVNPGIELPTAPVFAALQGHDNAPMPDLPARFGDVGAALDWIAAQRNDLQAAAVALAPPVGAVLDCLGGQKAAQVVRMSGSGATCFALFSSLRAAQDAQRAIRAAHPGWWVEATHLR